MKLVLTTWDGHDINDGSSYTARIPEGMLVHLSSEPQYVARAGEFPLLSATNLPPHYFAIKIEIYGANETMRDRRDTLKGWFDIKDQTYRNLVAEDDDNSDKEWYLTGIPVSLQEEGDRFLVVTLALVDPIWRSVDSNSETWAITASGQKLTVTPDGNQPAKPIIVITPTSGRTGSWTYKRWCSVYLPSTMTAGVARYPVELTDGGLNTAALVTASKMQADGDDLRVIVDSHEFERWLEDMNDTATKVWSNLDFSVPIHATLAADIAGAGAVSTISLTTDAVTLARLGNANNKVVIVVTSGTAEAYTYAGIDPVSMTLTGCQRAQKGTSAAAHSIGDAVIWVEHDVWLIYGNAAATAPVVDDGNKPLLNMSTSTNGSWVFANLYDSTSARPGAWMGGVAATQGKASYTYTGDKFVFANPSTRLGMAMLAWLNGSFWKSETAELAWMFYLPCGITHVACSGDKYRVGAATDWPALAGMQKSTDGTNWTEIFAEASPASASTWAAISHASTDLSGTFNWIRAILKGTVAAVASNIAALQYYALTFTLDATKIPDVTLSAEQSNYHLAARITNNETGEYIVVTYPIALNKAITINCVAKTATYVDGAEILGAVQLSSVRADWLNIGPGATELQFDDVGSAGLTIVVSWQDRML